ALDVLAARQPDEPEDESAHVLRWAAASTGDGRPPGERFTPGPLLGRGSFLAIGDFGQYLLCVPPGLLVVHLRAVPDDGVLARSQGTQLPDPLDSSERSRAL